MSVHDPYAAVEQREGMMATTYAVLAGSQTVRLDPLLAKGQAYESVH